MVNEIIAIYVVLIIIIIWLNTTYIRKKHPALSGLIYILLGIIIIANIGNNIITETTTVDLNTSLTTSQIQTTQNIYPENQRILIYPFSIILIGLGLLEILKYGIEEKIIKMRWKKNERTTNTKSNKPKSKPKPRIRRNTNNTNIYNFNKPTNNKKLRRPKTNTIPNKHSNNTNRIQNEHTTTNNIRHTIRTNTIQRKQNNKHIHNKTKTKQKWIKKWK